MTEKEISRLFDELSEAAQTLNDESDTVTTLIHQFETRLNGLRIGVEAWVTMSEARKAVRRPNSDADDLDDDGNPRTYSAEESVDVQLGFGRYFNDWRLLVRTAEWEKIDGGDWEEVTVERPTPLLEASRQIRIDALEAFPELLRELKKMVVALAAKVEAAKAIVK